MTTPIKTARVKVVHIIRDWNMCSVHKLRLHKKSKALKTGSCVVAFNKSQTIGRIVDWKGGVHTYYAETGRMFDLDTLGDMVLDSFYVNLYPGVTAKHQASQLWEAA
jgi:hypothetical protein